MRAVPPSDVGQEVLSSSEEVFDFRPPAERLHAEHVHEGVEAGHGHRLDRTCVGPLAGLKLSISTLE